MPTECKPRATTLAIRVSRGCVCYVVARVPRPSLRSVKVDGRTTGSRCEARARRSLFGNVRDTLALAYGGVLHTKHIVIARVVNTHDTR